MLCTQPYLRVAKACVERPGSREKVLSASCSSPRGSAGGGGGQCSSSVHGPAVVSLCICLSPQGTLCVCYRLMTERWPRWTGGCPFSVAEWGHPTYCIPLLRVKLPGSLWPKGGAVPWGGRWQLPQSYLFPGHRQGGGLGPPGVPVQRWPRPSGGGGPGRGGAFVLTLFACRSTQAPGAEVGAVRGEGRCGPGSPCRALAAPWGCRARTLAEQAQVLGGGALPRGAAAGDGTLPTPPNPKAEALEPQGDGTSRWDPPEGRGWEGRAGPCPQLSRGLHIKQTEADGEARTHIVPPPLFISYIITKYLI